MAPASISLKTDIKLLVAEYNFVAGHMARHFIRWHGLVGSVADGAAGVGHVIHQNGHAVFDVAHQDHAVHFVGLLPFFVDEGKIHVQAVGDGCHTAQRTQRKSMKWPSFRNEFQRVIWALASLQRLTVWLRLRPGKQLCSFSTLGCFL